MKKLFIFLLIAVFTAACSSNSENESKNPSSPNTVQVKESENKAPDDVLKKAIIDAYDNFNRTIEFLKVKKYEQGYLALTLFKGEGGGIALYYIEEGENGTFTAKGLAGGDAAMSMGFGVNRFTMDNHTIFFCNLNESTWIPENDTRKETKYTRIVFEFDDGNTVEEPVANERGYILIYTGIAHVKDMKLYNAKNELVNVYKDVGSTTEAEYHTL